MPKAILHAINVHHLAGTQHRLTIQCDFAVAARRLEYGLTVDSLVDTSAAVQALCPEREVAVAPISRVATPPTRAGNLAVGDNQSSGDHIFLDEEETEV